MRASPSHPSASALVTLATADPIGFAVGGATLEEAARRNADPITEVLRQRFEERGWS